MHIRFIALVAALLFGLGACAGSFSSDPSGSLMHQSGSASGGGMGGGGGGY